MISFPVSGTENNEQILDNLIKINPGYFLSEGVVKKIIELDPEMKLIFDNAIKVESGYYMSDGVTIDLANYVQDINDENTRLELMAEKLNNTIQEEREMAQLVFAEKDKIIELQNEQLKDYKELYEHRNKGPDLVEKTSQVASIIALLLLVGNL